MGRGLSAHGKKVKVLSSVHHWLYAHAMVLAGENIIITCSRYCILDYFPIGFLQEQIAEDEKLPERQKKINKHTDHNIVRQLEAKYITW